MYSRLSMRRDSAGWISRRPAAGWRRPAKQEESRANFREYHAFSHAQGIAMKPRLLLVAGLALFVWHALGIGSAPWSGRPATSPNSTESSAL